MSFHAPARASASQMGKPVGIRDIVPGNLRFNINHKIFWTSKSNRTADQYNFIATHFTRPCYRRWLEFTGGRVPKHYPYLTPYDPPTITPGPSRTWTLVRGTEEIATYTNCVEAWLLCLAGNAMQPKEQWAVVYTDRLA
jgi:hypothetical protein